MQVCLRGLTLVLAILPALGGCREHASSTPAQLQDWLDAAQRAAPTNPAPLAPSRHFVPLVYETDTGDTPFGRPADTRPSQSVVRPAQRGSPQPLEDFALETMHMVGSISQGRRRHVLLQAGSMIYQASIGDYAGKNFGMIRRISDTETELEELIADADGNWTARQVTLTLRGKHQ